MKKLLRMAWILLAFWILGYFLLDTIYTYNYIDGDKEPKIEIVQATISDKQFKEEHSVAGYRFFSHYPAEYNVTIRYEDLVKVYDSKELYDAVETGETIEMKMTTYYDPNGNVKSRKIEMVEQ